MLFLSTITFAFLSPGGKQGRGDQWEIWLIFKETIPILAVMLYYTKPVTIFVAGLQWREGTVMRQRKSQDQEDALTPVETPTNLLDVVSAARWLGVSRTKLFELMQEEDFPVMRITERIVRFDPNSLYRWALKRQRNSFKT